MKRVKFVEGEQRKFLDLVVEKLNAPSLRGILQFGFGISYSALKNYYNEFRLLPGDFFWDLCDVAKIDRNSLNFEYLEDNWGKVKGGQVGKR